MYAIRSYYVIRDAVKEALGTRTVSYQGRPLDFEKPFTRLTMSDAIRKYAPEYWSNAQLRDREFLAGKLSELGVEFSPQAGWGALQLMLFETVAEKNLIAPTYVLDFPVEVSASYNFV